MDRQPGTGEEHVEDREIPVAQRQPALTPPPRLVTPSPANRYWIMGLGGLSLFSLTLLALNRESRPLTPATLSVTQPLATPTVVSDPSTPAPVRASILGHFEYDEATPEDLTVVGRFRGREIRLRHSAAQQLKAMLAAAEADNIRLVPISGFRSIQDQNYLFFQLAQARSLRPEERADVSAPPGYSEHHTGYAVDLGDRAAPATDLTPNFDKTPGFKWLATHAARYGFELSFPQDNPQGISYEPWHWRYVGNQDSLETFYQQQSPIPIAQ